MPQEPKSKRERPLTPRQVADAFNVTLVTVASWADEGKLPYFRTPGGHRRFRQVDVDALLAVIEPEVAAS